MHFQSFIIIVSAALAAATPVDSEFAIEKRQSNAAGASNAVRDMRLALIDGSGLNDTVNANCDTTTAYYSFQLPTLYNQNQQLQWDLGNATQSVNATSGTFPCGDSTSIQNTNAALYSTLVSVITNLQNHYQAFKAANLVSTVHDNLVTQKALAVDLTYAVQAKLPSPYSASVPAVRNQFIAVYNAGIATFSK